MFSNDIALTPSSGVPTTSGTATTFALIGVSDEKSVRRNATTGLALPHELLISHQEIKVKGQPADRHIIRVDKTYAANGDIPEQFASAYLVIVAPRLTVTQANVNDQVGALLHQCNTVTNLTKILNGEV